MPVSIKFVAGNRRQLADDEVEFVKPSDVNLPYGKISEFEAFASACKCFGY
ncbi:MAG: hypothetical protein GX434_12915 [Peptococcaceae bacterium]|nr:hypothetical protein [Peptococcaceae bacterium]